MKLLSKIQGFYTYISKRLLVDYCIGERNLRNVLRTFERMQTSLYFFFNCSFHVRVHSESNLETNLLNSRSYTLNMWFNLFYSTDGGHIIWICGLTFSTPRKMNDQNLCPGSPIRTSLSQSSSGSSCCISRYTRGFPLFECGEIPCMCLTVCDIR